ncbi:hypothetical protein CEP53_007531 [Fusarium sp. AF-6]|nr:hypothetical protein CEP53_007531 [Fusarium sp. AF-6]
MMASSDPLSSLEPIASDLADAFRARLPNNMATRAWPIRHLGTSKTRASDLIDTLLSISTSPSRHIDAADHR